MKKTLTVNYASNTIEMTDAFANAASIVGSNEYRMLTETKRDFPNFTINVISTRKRTNNHFKNLDFDYMENYIRTHDNNDDILKEFASLRGMTIFENKLVPKSDQTVRAAASFFEIKQWFLETYHEAFENYDSEIRAILEKSKNARKARKAS